MYIPNFQLQRLWQGWTCYQEFSIFQRHRQWISKLHVYLDFSRHGRLIDHLQCKMFKYHDIVFVDCIEQTTQYKKCLMFNSTSTVIIVWYEYMINTHFENYIRFSNTEIVLPEVLVVCVYHTRQTGYVENILTFHVLAVVKIRQSCLDVFNIRTCITRNTGKIAII